MKRRPPRSTHFPYTTLIRSAKIQLDTAEVANLRRSFVGAITSMWSVLGVAPAALTDSAKSKADKERLAATRVERSEEHTSELQSRQYLVCRLLLDQNSSHSN